MRTNGVWIPEVDGWIARIVLEVGPWLGVRDDITGHREGLVGFSGVQEIL